MKKRYYLIVGTAIIILLLIYLSVFGVQTISTDKNVYSVGEEVKIHWSDLSLEWCTCGGNEIQIFKQATEWEKVQYNLFGFWGGACVNGKVVSAGMPCDVVSCSFPRLDFKDGDLFWNSKTYEFIGTVASCTSPYNNEIVNETLNNYELQNAPPGKYKITFGSAQEVIEIK